MASKYGYMATIGADTSGLTSALQTVDSEAKKISSELREINKNLKFEDGGAVALQQKYDLLNSAIEQTAQKLEMLKKTENDVNAAAESGKISEANQRSFQRELDSTANKLARYQKEAEETNKVLQDMASGQQTANNAMQTSEEIADIVQKAMQRYTDSAKNASASNKEESESLDEVGESAKNAAEELKKITLSNNIGYDESAIDYIENFGKKTEEAVSAYDKYKSSVGETNEAIRQAETEYNKLNKMLADNADNQVLTAQKNEIKNQLIEAETYKLEKLNQQYNAIKQAFDSGDIGAEQFREFQREIEQTKIKLAELEKSEEDASDAVKDYEKAIEGAGKQTVTFGDLVKANFLGNIVADGFHRAGSAISDFVKQGVDLASNLTEVQNVVDVTFGDGAEQIYQWADAATESFGMSSLAAQQYNGTMGAMLKSMGLADNEVKKISMDMVGLAGDMASFRNLDVETAFNKIRSGISGETEPLKQLGINMSVANLEAYALAHGIETAYKEMTEAEKAQLRYNYLMSQTADAQGDFARTSDSFANQQRILDLQIQNFSASLGKKLLPHLNDVIITINDKMPQAQATAEKLITPLADGFGWLIDNGDAVIAVLGSLAAGAGAYAVAAGGATMATELWAAATAKLAKIKAAINPLALVAAAAIAGAVAFKNYVDNMDISAPEEEFVRNVREETEALQQQRQAFEDLRKSQSEKDEADLASANNIKRLWEELQTYVDENGNVISSNERASEIIGLLNDNYNMNIGFLDGQIQKYSELSSSMDDYIENLRLEARIRNGQQSYDEAIRNIDDLMKKRDELKQQEKVQYKTYEKLKAQGLDNADDVAERRNAISNEIAEIDALISEYESAAQEYESFFEKKKSSGSGGQTWAPDDPGDEEPDPDQELKDYVADLDERKDLRKISEQEYYDELYKGLIQYEDRESKEWFKQLGRYEDYQQKQADAAVKASEKAVSEQEKLEKEATEERINTIKGYWDKVTRMKDRGEIGDEEEYKLKAKIVKQYCDENEDTWDSYYKWLYDYTKKQEEEIADARLKAWEDNTKALSDKLEKSYSDLKSQKEQVRKELLNIDLSETVVDKNGNEIEILNDLDAEIKKIDRYTASVEKLEETGISDSLLAKIGEMSYEDGSRQRYIDTLLNLSESNRQKYYSDWERLYAKEAEAEQKLLGDKEAELNQEAADTVKSIFGSMPEEAYADGVKTAQSYLQGILDSMEGVSDINAINALSDIAYSNAKGTARGASIGGGTSVADDKKYIPTTTPITFIIDGEKKIETTIQKIIDQSGRSGENIFHM